MSENIGSEIITDSKNLEIFQPTGKENISHLNMNLIELSKHGHTFLQFNITKHWQIVCGRPI